VNIEELIQTAAGKKEADLLIKNANLVNVLSGEIIPTDVAVSQGRVCGFGDYDASETIDIYGRYLLPGYIDGHIHIESSMVTVSEFAKAVVPLGTTAVIADPHEITNVLGIPGIKYMLDSSKYQPIDVYFMLPSCVPATDLETSGAIITAGDIFPYLNEKWVVGLGEMMDFPGVIECRKDVLDKIKLIRFKKIDGHAPGLTGKDLAAYIAAGVRSDHESTTLEEAQEKLRNGMHIMIRQGTVTKNLRELLPAVNSMNSDNFSFVTDDRSPSELLSSGHINNIVAESVRSGLDPVIAVKLATINTARYFKLANHGAIAPGYYADMQVLRDLTEPVPDMVFKNGKLVASAGKLHELEKVPKDIRIRGSVNVKWLTPKDFRIKASGKKVNVIDIIPSQIITKRIQAETPADEKGNLVSDPSRDLLKICVVERHMASGNIGIGLIRGMGLKEGAIATSVAHDSHNIVATGVTDRDISAACVEIVKMGGGIVAVKDAKVIERLPLPIAGLMSEESIQEVDRKLNKLSKAAKDLGSGLEDPYFALSFLCLPVIPELKITDKGLVDVSSFRIIDLFEE
jgi:adenine deaminase